MKFQIIIVVFATLTVFSESYNPYCHVPTCRDPSLHTLCLYTDDTKSDLCGKIIRAGLTDDERESILVMHNVFRERLHTGNEVRGLRGQQPAINTKNYVPLEWDYDLELAAQRWVNQCRNYRDVCRDMHDCQIGQNMQLVEANDGSEDLDFPVWDWYLQVDRFSGYEHRHFDTIHSIIHETFEYTQMVWRNTTKMGCAAISFSVYNKAKLLFACNYEPKGNIDNDLVY